LEGVFAWNDAPIVTRALQAHLKLGAFLHQLSHTTIEPTLLMEAIGWSGNIWYADWLIEQMQNARHACMVGEAFRLLTGFDFDDNEAAIEAPAAVSENDAAAPLAAVYPHPDAAKTAAWWRANGAAYENQPKLFLGQPITLAWLDDILDQGEQAHRELAALHRAVLRPNACLVPTHAHAMVQWQRLQQLKGISA
jgi:hypothetical protein